MNTRYFVCEGSCPDYGSYVICEDGKFPVIFSDRLNISNYILNYYMNSVDQFIKNKNWREVTLEELPLALSVLDF